MLEKSKKTDTTERPSLEGFPSAEGATPMMAQFLSIKEQYPDCLLFYRMGDFYELFFRDAEIASDVLDITLTKRGQHNGEDIPMCGVNVLSHEMYLARLVRAGHKVAVVEQTEDPAEAKKRGGSKALVQRDVIRVFTAGTLTEDSLLDARRHNYLAALAEAKGALGLAWMDLSTGAFSLQPVTAKTLSAALARLEPGEILLSERLLQKEELFETLSEWKQQLSPLPSARFDSENGKKRLEDAYGVKALDAFGAFERAELAAGGALIDYIALTQKGRMPRLQPPRRIAEDAILEIDAATRRNLELSQTLGGERAGSLLAVMDETVTGPGARLLQARLSAPLTDVDAINARLDMVQAFVDASDLRGQLRESLRKAPDMERALSRLGLGRGGPRDLAAVARGLEITFEIKNRLEAAQGAQAAGITFPEGISRLIHDLGYHGELVDRLRRALKDELPMYARDGDVIRAGYAPALDELMSLRDESRRLIANLQADYLRQTGAQSLKIKHNNVLGYFIEVPAKQADKLSDDPEKGFIHRQTMANAVRFTTVALSDLEGRISSAADKALSLELELFQDLVDDVNAHGADISRAAHALAELDLACSLAQLADDRSYVRPLVDGSRAFRIERGRHPVVEAALTERSGDPFVPNDCTLDEDNRLWLLSGPNMAGKSTFLRQNALIAVMAQMGAFVPADKAHIGLIDRVFSRVGASDDLARGRSTFMVEMVETASILNQATDRSLVILDEIGRGTATFDGLSIAWAVVEALHEVNRCRGLFATHYHELNALTAKLDALSSHTMKVKEWQGDVIFLHEVANGAADRSYGIHVGRLAGLPEAVVARAQDVLEALEKDEQRGSIHEIADDLPLFSAASGVPGGSGGDSGVESDPRLVELKAALDGVNPDEMSPREALEALYRLKLILKD